VLGGPLKPHIVTGIAKVSTSSRGHHQIKAIRAGNGYCDLSFMRLSQHPQTTVAILITDISRVYEMGRVADGFLSCISHELRTPLTGIQAAVEILTQMTGQTGFDSREFLDVIDTESRRLSRIVDDVLEFTNLEGSDAPWILEAVNVLDILYTVRRQSEGRLSAGALSVDIDAKDREVTCLGERARLTQVLHKVLDNAIKFSPPGGRILLSARLADEQVQVWVEDSGEGIDVEERETVFQQFRQIGDGITDKPAGTGLGLAMCRRILSRMGGVIWCDDSQLGGARIRFTLPTAPRPDRGNARVMSPLTLAPGE
jgi:signal transduction histidine kinase